MRPVPENRTSLPILQLEREFVKKFLFRRWFLILLCSVLIVGISQAEHLEALSKLRAIRYGIVATVLFLMAFPLDIRDMWAALRRPGAPLLASVMNFGLTPLFAWGLAAGLSVLGLLGRELQIGLFVAATTPCTLASAAVWTRRARGNDSVALMVTVLTNATCFLITPLWLFVMTGRQAKADSLELSSMIVRLGLLVVLPMTVAQSIRLVFRPAAHWASANKTGLGVLAQCGVLSMVFMGAIRTGLRITADGKEQLLLAEFLIMAAAIITVHLTMLASGMRLARLLGFGRKEEIAIGIAGSQKTLMVGLQVGMDLGVSILPIVVYHVSQLFLDTIIADRIRHRDESKAACDRTTAQPAPGSAVESQPEQSP